MRVRFIKGVGEKREKLLKKLGIENAFQLLNHFPIRYENRIPSTNNDRINIKAAIESLILHKTHKLYILELRIKGRKERFFIYRNTQNEKIFAPVIEAKNSGTQIFITGRRNITGDVDVEEYVINDPENIHHNRFVPVYETIEGLDVKTLREIIYRCIFEYKKTPAEFYTPEILKKINMPELETAYREIHFPSSLENVEKIKERFIFDEFFFICLGFERLKLKTSKLKKESKKITRFYIDAFIKKLGFKLTAAQNRCIEEILCDIESPAPMRRLLQGEVGSGKTVVAITMMLAQKEAGYQCVFVAPTEVLAFQHYTVLKEYLSFLENTLYSLKIGILTSSIKGLARQKLLSEIKNGECDIVVSTHAIFENVEFKKLGGIIIDEQHKFGVAQRLKLLNKYPLADYLVMTATPIPRTLAYIFYGELDYSLIDTMPYERRVETIYMQDPEKIFSEVRKSVEAGGKAYIIFPVIEESKIEEIASLKKSYEDYSKKYFHDIPTGLLHGRLKHEEKISVMNKFKTGEIKILFSTPVVEVGLDVKEADIMVCINFERFGVAQLHQLRGRIGRKGQKSKFILTGNPSTENSKKRLKAILENEDGMKLSMEDLKIRGPGGIFDFEQTGWELKNFAYIFDRRGMELLKKAKDLAKEIASKFDPEYRNIYRELNFRFPMLRDSYLSL